MTESEEPPPLRMQRTAPSWWFALAIGSTMCCMPLGIVGIVYCVLALVARERAEWDPMLRHTRRARWWTGSAIAIGVALWATLVLTTDRSPTPPPPAW